MKSNAEWLEWGRRDPLQGVATWPGRERDGPSPWTDDEFYALGASEWADYFRVWQRYGVNSDHGVEFGCGAGRMTRSLAGVFTRVTGLDISPEQMAYARAHLADDNVNFVVTDGVRIPLPTAEASAFFSTYVFQHFPALRDASGVLDEVTRILAPGASLFLQVPLYRLPNTKIRPLLRWMHVSERRVAGWKTDWQRRRGRLVMRMLWYEREWLESELRRRGFGEIEFLSVRMTANGHWNDLVLARRQ